GTIEKTGEGKFTVNGIVKKLDDQTVEITELPIGTWTQSYKEQLEAWVTGTDKVPAIIKVNKLGEIDVDK
ncbi:DNA topoisomerase 2, partial [Tulasnella sp. 419]